MNSSESEGFESADEGISSPNKRERKKRLSSSNYSDNVSDQDTKNNPTKFDNLTRNIEEHSADSQNKVDIHETSKSKTCTEEAPSDISKKEESTGWDDFDDWGDTNVVEFPQKQANDVKQQQDIKSVTQGMAAASTKSDGWGWGWGVDSLLSTATAGISNITSQVSQGISTVLETGIGAPDPEELARRSVKHNESISTPKDNVEQKTQVEDNTNETLFPFGSLISGVTKFVETTGTKVISGGLDTLETIGKKTMEVLQDGDPGLAKKRAMLGLDSGDKPVLSQLLREAKEKADEEDSIREARREAKEIHYETLFDDFEGLVHLEALEMLSKQIQMRIDEKLRSTSLDKRQDIKETLQQVAELCELPEDDDDYEEDDDNDDKAAEESSKSDAFHEKLRRATKDIGVKMQFQPLIRQYTEILDWLDKMGDVSEKAIYKRAVSGLAQVTALCMELYHKTAEMLLVKSRRSTADEADALTQLTVVLTKHIGELATLFTEKLNALSAGDSEPINNYTTNVFLEAGNSSKYIENSFQLALPILQIGAV